MFSSAIILLFSDILAGVIFIFMLFLFILILLFLVVVVLIIKGLPFILAFGAGLLGAYAEENSHKNSKRASRNNSAKSKDEIFDDYD